MEEEGGGVSSAATSNVNEGHADAVVVELMEIVDAKPSGGEEGQDITGEAVAAAVEDTINADPQQQQQQQQEVHVKKVKKTKFRKSADTIEGGVVTGGPSGLATRKIKKVRLGDKEMTRKMMPKLPTAASRKNKDKGVMSKGEGGPPSSSSGGGSGGYSAQQAAVNDMMRRGSGGYSAQQAAVNDMMRRALEEDKYSALGSIVDTDSSDDDDDDDYDDGAGGDEEYSGNSRLEEYDYSNIDDEKRRPRRGGGTASDSSSFATSIKTYTNGYHSSNTQGNKRKMDRNSMLSAMRRHMRIEGLKSVRNFDSLAFLEDAEDYLDVREGRKRRKVSTMASSSMPATTTTTMTSSSLASSTSPAPLQTHTQVGEDDDDVGVEQEHGDENGPGEELDSAGRKIGKRRKKKKKRGGNLVTAIEAAATMITTTTDNFKEINVNIPAPGLVHNEDGEYEAEGNNPASSGGDGWGKANNDTMMNDNNNLYVGEEEQVEEPSIFGQTDGASNATWVECDRCKKWRRLRGVVDARKLPPRWYCTMNKTDPDHARCSAPEEEYESSTTPESAMDQRIRRHLRVWVRRLHCNEAYETRLRSTKKRTAVLSDHMSSSSSSSSKEPYEWVRCCNPSCGKWRMLLRSMDASSVIDKCKNGEWYCVMNTWDEKAASCGATQENLPNTGCPPWVLVDEWS